MGNKTKAKPAKNNTWMIIGGAAIMIVIVWATMKYTGSNPATEQAVQPNGEPITLIATLDPQNFTGRARAAYQAAKEIPEVLAQLPCFCGCMDSIGHKSNLYCFADDHGNICDLCQTIALDAQDMHRKGMPTTEIREKIRTAYAHIQ